MMKSFSPVGNVRTGGRAHHPRGMQSCPPHARNATGIDCRIAIHTVRRHADDLPTRYRHHWQLSMCVQGSPAPLPQRVPEDPGLYHAGVFPVSFQQNCGAPMICDGCNHEPETCGRSISSCEQEADEQAAEDYFDGMREAHE